jgi:hypothetical protein
LTAADLTPSIAAAMSALSQVAGSDSFGSAIQPEGTEQKQFSFGRFRYPSIDNFADY